MAILHNNCDRKMTELLQFCYEIIYCSCRFIYTGTEAMNPLLFNAACATLGSRNGRYCPCLLHCVYAGLRYAAQGHV